MTQIEISAPVARTARCSTRTPSGRQELGLDYEIEKITDIGVIIGYRVMSTPALVVNGEVKVSGRVPSVEQPKEMLK